MLRKEECALSMELRESNAAEKDAQIELRKEGYALGMGRSTNDAVVKVAQKMRGKEECVGGMGHAIQTMNPLHLDHYSNRRLQLRHK